MTCTVLRGTDYTMHVFFDPFNRRLRVDDYEGNADSIANEAYALMKERGLTKAFIKAKEADWQTFLARGYMLEGVFKGYFRGKPAYSVALYASDERRMSNYWMQEDEILQQVLKRERHSQLPELPPEFRLRPAAEADARALACLYAAVFEVYPTPMFDADYVRKVLVEGTVFYVIDCNGSIVSAASAEMNESYRNAEMTDCATPPEYRKFGFMKLLLAALEQEMKHRRIGCVYSLSRALSYGMNAVFHQLGYGYTGRLTNNCYIFDKLEDMNLWVKALES
ncbi:putative beta-lysine N-acetyltransferase [Paenibacillus sp. P25]|nr:putative beta-lysine N-acetyltransferase [Paenibacillus sp. P25]